MMMGAELSHPADWLQSGHALSILDDFALQHRGVTGRGVPRHHRLVHQRHRCVQRRPRKRRRPSGQRIRAVCDFALRRQRRCRQLGPGRVVVGGTCSLMLAVSHPERFSAIVDLDGQLGPNAGTKKQTIARLFGGDADAWAAFDPEDHRRLTVATTDWPPGSECPIEFRPCIADPATAQRSRSPRRTGTVTRRPQQDRESAVRTAQRIRCRVLGRRVCRRPRLPLLPQTVSGMPYPGWRDAWGAGVPRMSLPGA